MKKGLEEYEKKHPSNVNYKYAVLHVGHSLELLLKSRLAFEDRFYILADLDKPDKGTINTRVACQRLRSLCRIDIKPNDLSVIEAIREKRNEIEHFAFEPDRESLDSILTVIVSFWLEFMKAQFPDYSISDLLDSGQVRLVGHMDREHHRLYETATRQINDVVRGLEEDDFPAVVETCDYCLQHAVLSITGRETAKCYYCQKEYAIGYCRRCQGAAAVTSVFAEMEVCEPCLFSWLDNEASDFDNQWRIGGIHGDL